MEKVPGELMSWLLNGTGKFVLMLPLIVKVEVVLWSLDDVFEELVMGSVVEPDDWAAVDETKHWK